MIYRLKPFRYRYCEQHKSQPEIRIVNVASEVRVITMSMLALLTVFSVNWFIACKITAHMLLNNCKIMISYNLMFDVFYSNVNERVL